MVGPAVGSTAIVGISFAVVYWQFAFAFGIEIAGGTIRLVAQRHSAGQSVAARLADDEEAGDIAASTAHTYFDYVAGFLGYYVREGLLNTDPGRKN